MKSYDVPIEKITVFMHTCSCFKYKNLSVPSISATSEFEMFTYLLILHLQLEIRWYFEFYHLFLHLENDWSGFLIMLCLGVLDTVHHHVSCKTVPADTKNITQYTTREEEFILQSAICLQT